MAQMDISPIKERILKDAKHTAESFLSEAKARVNELQATADSYVADSQRRAAEEAALEGDAAEKNLRRLSALEDRKALLALKHQLIDEGFELAYEKLCGLPQDQLRALFMERVLAVAEGKERLAVGAVHPGFFQGFVEEANKRLSDMGKPAGLTDAGEQRQGECGVILISEGSQVYCTARTLLDEKRNELEGPVAQMLCRDLT